MTTHRRRARLDYRPTMLCALSLALAPAIAWGTSEQAPPSTRDVRFSVTALDDRGPAGRILEGP